MIKYIAVSKEAKLTILIAIIIGALALGFGAMATNATFPIPIYVPFIFFGIAIAAFVWLIILLIIDWSANRKGKQKHTIRTRTEAAEQAKVIWGLWYTGEGWRYEKLFEEGKIKRLLLLNPSMRNPTIDQNAEIVSCTPKQLRDEINIVKDEVEINHVLCKLYANPRGDSFTICDPSPIPNEKGELIPNSEKAWICIQFPSNKLKKEDWPIKEYENKGKGKNTFERYFKEFGDIWNNHSVYPKDMEKPFGDDLKKLENKNKIKAQLKVIDKYEEEPFNTMTGCIGLIIKNESTDILNNCHAKLLKIDFETLQVGKTLSRIPANKDLPFDKNIAGLSSGKLQIMTWTGLMGQEKTQVEYSDGTKNWLPVEYQQALILLLHIWDDNCKTIYAVCRVSDRLGWGFDLAVLESDILKNDVNLSYFQKPNPNKEHP